jgi:hypothetical protein
MVSVSGVTKEPSVITASALAGLASSQRGNRQTKTLLYTPRIAWGDGCAVRSGVNEQGKLNALGDRWELEECFDEWATDSPIDDEQPLNHCARINISSEVLRCWTNSRPGGTSLAFKSVSNRSKSEFAATTCWL